MGLTLSGLTVVRGGWTDVRRAHARVVVLVQVGCKGRTGHKESGLRHPAEPIEIELKTGVRLRVTTDADLDYVVVLAQRLG